MSKKEQTKEKDKDKIKTPRQTAGLLIVDIIVIGLVLCIPLLDHYFGCMFKKELNILPVDLVLTLISILAGVFTPLNIENKLQKYHLTQDDYDKLKKCTNTPYINLIVFSVILLAFNVYYYVIKFTFGTIGVFAASLLLIVVYVIPPFVRYFGLNKSILKLTVKKFIRRYCYSKEVKPHYFAPRLVTKVYKTEEDFLIDKFVSSLLLRNDAKDIANSILNYKKIKTISELNPSIYSLIYDYLVGMLHDAIHESVYLSTPNPSFDSDVAFFIQNINSLIDNGLSYHTDSKDRIQYCADIGETIVELCDAEPISKSVVYKVDYDVISPLISKVRTRASDITPLDENDNYYNYLTVLNELIFVCTNYKKLWFVDYMAEIANQEQCAGICDIFLIYLCVIYISLIENYSGYQNDYIPYITNLSDNIKPSLCKNVGKMINYISIPDCYGLLNLFTTGINNFTTAFSSEMFESVFRVRLSRNFPAIWIAIFYSYCKGDATKFDSYINYIGDSNKSDLITLCKKYVDNSNDVIYWFKCLQKYSILSDKPTITEAKIKSFLSYVSGIDAKVEEYDTIIQKSEINSYIKKINRSLAEQDKTINKKEIEESNSIKINLKYKPGFYIPYKKTNINVSLFCYPDPKIKATDIYNIVIEEIYGLFSKNYQYQFKIDDFRKLIDEGAIALCIKVLENNLQAKTIDHFSPYHLYDILHTFDSSIPNTLDTLNEIRESMLIVNAPIESYLIVCDENKLKQYNLIPADFMFKS